MSKPLAVKAPPGPFKGNTLGLFERESDIPVKNGLLSTEFVFPPFSVLNAREGYWQDRKRAWVALGIRGELGRGDIVPGNGKANGNVYQNPEIQDRDYYRRKEGKRPQRADGTCYNAGLLSTSQKYKNKAAGLTRNTWLGASKPVNLTAPTDFEARVMAANPDSGTSIFDPVLCELMYRWFCPPGGRILDPFAGESTKGIVATYLKYNYTGIELRPEQVEVNYAQANAIGLKPNWVCGDSAKLRKILPAGEMYDFVWTSPPYFDLEIYSEGEKDGSAFETYEKFMAWYDRIFLHATARLKNNRFCAVKVGEVRDKKTGLYRNFIGDNVSCFQKAGLAYYNELMLVTSVGSLPIRAGKQFRAGRKIGKSHQNILLFVKGDPRKAAAACNGKS